MDIEITDYNNSDTLIEETYSIEWEEISEVLNNTPLHIKSSDQAGKQGKLIFDPVGTNSYIKNEMVSVNWEPNKEIPQDYRFLGSDIDFVKPGMIVEVQFSNYPFLLNNLLRSELFYKGDEIFNDHHTDLLVIITKNHILPSSNSTLYYEQARGQLNALFDNDIFKVPTRLVGLTVPVNESIECKRTTYDRSRYSRTVITQEDVSVRADMRRKGIRSNLDIISES